jgi:Cu2+-exporting ATPase
MDVPVSIAIGGAYIASVWATITQSGEVYYDSVSMFTFFLLIGRFFEMKARHRTGMAGNELANLLPSSATRITDAGEQLVPVSELSPGDRVLVKPGHSIPADGVLFTQHTSIDESALTGEPLPVSKQIGDHLVGGTINMEQAIEMEITSSAERSRMSSILNLLDRAQADKPKVAKIADKVASYFVAGVLLTAIVVSLIWWQISPEDAFWVTLSVLVVTCPCALSLATPTALTAAIGSMRKMGILVTRGHVLESLAQCTSVYFDKTGTLTTGKLTLNKTTSLCEQSTEELNQLAAAIESRSEHPIASAFTPYFEYSVEEATNHVGKGVEGTLKERTYRIGKPEFVAELYKNDPPAYPDGSSIYLLMGDEFGPLAWFAIDDQLRPEAIEAVKQIQALGLPVGMLTGDREESAKRIASELGIDHVEAQLTPEDKLARVKAMQKDGERILMIGDGINDIPVLSGAQTSIAMNSATDLAKTSSDAVLVSSDLRRIPGSLNMARKTRNIIRQNIGWSLFYNLIALPLAASGFIAPWMAAIGMSLSSLIVVGNALRLTKQL